MLKLIGLGFVVYVGWVTGFIQTLLLLAAGLLTYVAGL